MAIENIFSVVDKAILVSTGNSLIVCGSTTEPEINTSDLIKIDGTTTRDWTQAGSTANLGVLADSTILYAELMWYSTVFSNVQGALDLRSIQDTPILFTTSKGTYEITPTFTESYTSLSGTVDRYRAAIVTEYVKAALAGSYTVTNVPISVPILGLSNSRGGWALSVIYRNDLLRPQKIAYSSGIMVATPSTPLQTMITGFSTGSNQNALRGSMTMIVANGGSLNGTEIVSSGPSFVDLSNIGNVILSPNANPGTKPNNPGNRFFSGLINTADPLSNSNGLININGTNGANNNDGFIPIQLVGARNKWDITNVDISNTLVLNQTVLATQITTDTVGDGVALLGLGAQVYAKAPNMIVTLEAFDVDGDKELNVEVGDVQVYSIKIKNIGDIAANNVMVSAIINSVTTFISGSVMIDGVINPTADIRVGVNVGTVKPNGITTVLFRVRVNSVPPGGMLYQNANYRYEFQSDTEIIINQGTTNTLAIIVQEGKLTIMKVASKTAIVIGDIVSYTINIHNVGTELARDMFFQDKMDVNCSFVPGTVIIDGISYSNYDPVIGIQLPNLAVGNSIEIVFGVEVNTLPASTKVTNISFISFGYIYNQYGYMRKKTTASNKTTIQIQFVDVIGERCDNNSYPQVGDIVTYTLSLTNMGNIPAVGIQVLEPTIQGTDFVAGSVKINGISEPSLNPFSGFTLTNPINPQQTTDIEYEVVVNSLNPEGLIPNMAKVPFKYQNTPYGDIIDWEKDSNVVNTMANYVCMNIVKSVNTPYAEIGDIIYYTTTITNDGNINAINTEFMDPLQSNLSFVGESVTINGIPYPNYNPILGFLIGTICPGDSIEVGFQAIIISRPTPNIIYNNSSVIYQYQPNPSGGLITDTILSNTVQTIINEAKYSVVKSVNKDYAQVGDVLLYTTIIQNTGTVALTNMKFADYIPDFLALIPGSVYINGVNYPNLNPPKQFTISDMYPGDTTTIIFEVTVLVNPPTSLIVNMSEVTFSYKQSPDSPIITKTVYSNEVETIDPSADLKIVKYVDKGYAAVGEVLIYSFTVTNDGTTSAVNNLFTDILQAEISFIEGSVSINGISMPSYDPQIGFALENITAGQVVAVQFRATVNSLPEPNTIGNSATTIYSYYVNPNQQPVTKTSKSNVVTTIINTYSAIISKVVDKGYATIGDTLNYTVTVTNTGTVSLTNVNFIDLVPNGATFVEGSVIVNGQSEADVNPNLGFSIKDITAGSSVVVIFKVIVTSLPLSLQINNTASVILKYRLSPTMPYIDDILTSNTVTTIINVMSVTNTKSVSKAYATVGDTLTYTSVILNDGTISIENNNFIDNIPAHLRFVQGSVKIDGIAYSSYNPNTGFIIGDIAAGLQKIITFDVTVDSVPANGYVENLSLITYEYKINPNNPYILASKWSNSVITYINLGNLIITKKVNRVIVRLTNIITYDFVITNIGNTLLQDLYFSDVVQAESTFNSGSVYINGINKPSYNPNSGFDLDNIPIGQQTTISFQVTANEIPVDNKLLNSGNVIYGYYVDPSGNPIINNKTSNTTTVYVYDTIVSANKTVDKSIAKLGETINFTITVKNDGNISAQHVFFKDTLDNNITFVEDSVYINGIQKVGYNPNDGFNLDDIVAGVTTTINIAAIVISRPIDNIIYNIATIDYDYIVGTEVITAIIKTNITKTYFAIGELTITKSVDKIYATVGDNIAYTIIVKNTGSVNATGLILQDLIQEEATFNLGTVMVDGVSQPLFDPNVGFGLSNLMPSDFHVISFNVNVISLPQGGEIDNSANVTFTYKLTPIDTPVTITTTSNIVITYIRLGNLIATKIVDKSYATLGNTLNYTITINNVGNANCFDIFFKDLIQVNGSFITGTVKVNGVPYIEYNPNIGFSLNDIPGYSTTIVTFSVLVETLPLDYVIYNFATDRYKYYINPSNESIVAEGNTNTVTTVINVGKLIAIKSVSKDYATIGDIVIYTVNVTNIGNTLTKNVNFSDTIPTGLSFVPGSVKINGIAYPTYDPNLSFTLGNIIANNNIIITFDTIVTKFPSTGLAINSSQITFYYKVNPSEPDIVVVVNSNTVTTQIKVASLSIIKSVDKDYATVGDEVTYTVNVTNNGNVIVENILFTDKLQQDVIFNLGSVKINGIGYPNYNPNEGFYLDNINPTESVIVNFKVTISASPTQTALLNNAVATFQYKVETTGQYYSKSTQSNTVLTWIILSRLTITKIVDKLYATLQDTLNYSILVKNTGSTTISEIVFTDFLSDGAVFINGTVIIDGVSYPSYNPINGFNLPKNLVAGSTSLVEFKAMVIVVPSPPQVTNYATTSGIYYVNPYGPSFLVSAASNIVITNINTGSISNTKSVDKNYAVVDNIINYTSTIINTGNVELTNIFFTDILESSLSFEIGTLSINGVIYPMLDPTVGFNLANLPPLQSVTVEFSAKIISLPVESYVTNNSNVQYSYKINPSGYIITKDKLSNNVITNVILGKLNAVKSVDKSIATIGEDITYTVALTNIGNVIDNDVLFQDIPSTGVSFKGGSVKVNNTSEPTYDPILGFNLGDIGIGTVVIVSFIVTVISVPSTNQVTNQAVIPFKYVVNPQELPYNSTAYSNIVWTNIVYGNLDVTKVVDKKYATIGEELTYTITIVNIGNINAIDVVFVDQIPHNTMFILGSVKVNGTGYPDYNPSAGFDLGTIIPGQIVTVIYKVEVLNLC